MTREKVLMLLGSVCLALMLTVLAVGCAGPAPEKVTKLLMRANSTTSGYYAYCVAASEVINRAVPDISVTVTSIAGAMDALKRLSLGEVDFINVVGNDGSYQRYHGIGGFEGEPEPKLRLMYVLDASTVAYVVREDSGITKVEDLEGKKFSPGGIGTSTARQTKAVLDIIGVHPNYYEGSFSDAVAAVKDNRVVGFVKASPLGATDSTIMEIETAIPIRILEWPEDALSKVQKEIPYYSAGWIAAGLYDYDWNKEPIRTWAKGHSCCCLSDLSDDIVYKIVKAICEDKDHEDIQGSTFKGVEGLDMAELTVDTDLANSPLHAGTIKYLRDRGFTIPDELIPPEAK